MTIDQIIPVLQLSIGPAILISGAGLILLSMTNRYARVIDRARHLSDDLRSDSAIKNTRIQRQIRILARRSRMLRLAITLVSTSLLFASLLVIALFLMALMGYKEASLIVFLFISCMASLILGLLVFLLDVNISLSALNLQINAENYKGE